MEAPESSSDRRGQLHIVDPKVRRASLIVDLARRDGSPLYSVRRALHLDGFWSGVRRHPADHDSRYPMRLTENCPNEGSALLLIGGPGTPISLKGEADVIALRGATRDETVQRRLYDRPSQEFRRDLEATAPALRIVDHPAAFRQRGPKYKIGIGPWGPLSAP